MKSVFFKFRTQFERLVIHDGLLCRRKRHPSGILLHQVVIPHAIIPTVLSILHSSSPALHFGTTKTTELFEELCYWHGMRKDIAELCSHCEACQSYRQSAFPPSALPASCAVISHPSSPPPPPTTSDSSPSDISTDPLLNPPGSTCLSPTPPSDMSDIPAVPDELPVFTPHLPVGADIDFPSPPPSPSRPRLPTLLEIMHLYRDIHYPNYDDRYDTSPSPSLSPTSRPLDSPDYNVSTSQFHWSLPHPTFQTSLQDHPLIPAATSSPQTPITSHIPSHDVHAHNHDPVTCTRSGRIVRPPEYYGQPNAPTHTLNSCSKLTTWY